MQHARMVRTPSHGRITQDEVLSVTIGPWQLLMVGDDAFWLDAGCT
jgi:hypothetical protein